MSTLHKRLTRKYPSGSKKENRPNNMNQSSYQPIFLDASDQCRALYFLGLTYHLKAKELLSSTGGALDDNIRTLLDKAIVYYEQNLDLNQELNDKVAEGRTLGNIGNVNYLLQDYSTSIEYLEKRLAIAKENNDRAGQRRAYGNLGNAYLYLEDFDKSLYYYREAMSLGELMNDESFTARMNFTIGRVYSLKHDYDTAIYFHEKHLHAARQLEDSIGQCRAYFILSQLNEKISQHDKAKKYESLYKALAREIDEPTEDVVSMSAQSGPKNNLLKNLRTDSISITLSEGGGTNNVSSSSHSPHSARSNTSVNSSVADVRSYTGSHNLPTTEKSISNKSKKSKTNSISLRTNLMHHFGKKSPIGIRKESLPADHDELVDIVCRMQQSRFEDQRCDFKSAPENKNATRGHRPSTQLEDILNTVDRLQQFRLDDQRTALPSATNHDSNDNTTTKSQSHILANEQFFDQLAKCQDSRFDDQRAVLIPIQNHNRNDDNDDESSRPKSASSLLTTTPTTIGSPSKTSTKETISKTLPDDDFFSLLNRLQSRRIDQQRTCLPTTINSNTPFTLPTSSSTPAKGTRVKQ